MFFRVQGAGNSSEGNVFVEGKTSGGVGVTGFIQAKASNIRIGGATPNPVVFTQNNAECFRLDTTNGDLQLVSGKYNRWVSGNEQTTVGAAGGASALPASPTKWLKVKDSAGTVLVVPAYAAA